MPTLKPKLRRKVHKKIEVAPDLEIHVSTLTVAGVKLREIRNYIPSTGEYGRGITAPAGLPANEIITGLIEANREAKT